MLIQRIFQSTLRLLSVLSDLFSRQNQNSQVSLKTNWGRILTIVIQKKSKYRFLVWFLNLVFILSFFVWLQKVVHIRHSSAQAGVLIFRGGERKNDFLLSCHRKKNDPDSNHEGTIASCWLHVGKHKCCANCVSKAMWRIDFTLITACMPVVTSGVN